MNIGTVSSFFVVDIYGYVIDLLILSILKVEKLISILPKERAHTKPNVISLNCNKTLDLLMPFGTKYIKIQRRVIFLLARHLYSQIYVIINCNYNL